MQPKRRPEAKEVTAKAVPSVLAELIRVNEKVTAVTGTQVTEPVLNKLAKSLDNMQQLSACIDSSDVLCLFGYFIFTLLVPGGKASTTFEAVKRLIALDVIPEKPEELVVHLRGVRFANTKAHRLTKAIKQWPEVVALLREHLPLRETHTRLIELVDGVGPKVAAHFLRNIGVQSATSAFIPIVDTHIRKFTMCLNPTLSTNSPELVVANCFVNWCETEKVSGLLADAVIWAGYSGLTENTETDFDGFGYPAAGFEPDPTRVS